MNDFRLEHVLLNILELVRCELENRRMTSPVSFETDIPVESKKPTAMLIVKEGTTNTEGKSTLASSCMTKTLGEPEIDFLQRRVSSSVFTRNCFNQVRITFLKDRMLEAAVRFSPRY